MDAPALLDRILGTVDDPYARLAEDILDDINRIRQDQGEPLLDTLPAWIYCPGCRTLRVVK